MTAPDPVRPACLLLHGWAMNGAVWSDLAGRLESDGPVLTPDLPGHGRAADPPDGKPPLEALADRLEGRPSPGGPFTLVGWSLGGLIAIWLALRHPRECRRLVLIASSPCFVRRPGWSAAMSRATLDDFARRLEDDAGATISAFLALQFLGCRRALSARRALEASLARRPPARPSGLRVGLEALSSVDLRDRLAGLRMPVLVVQGRLDRIVPPAAAEALVDAVPDGRLEVVDTAGHAPFMSHPDRVAAAIGDFLR